MEWIDETIGSTDNVEWWQMMARAVAIFAVTLIFIRISNKRMFGKHTAFDIVLGIILGSILSRAITGNAPFFETILAGFTLVMLHRLLGYIAYKTESSSTFIKGKQRTLIEDGEIKWDVMKKSNISEHDLYQALRMNGNTEDVKKVKRAYLERSGDISVLRNDID